MAGVLQMLFEQEVVAKSSVTVAHNLNRQGLFVQVVVDGEVSADFLTSTSPTPVDPLNSIDIVFSGVTTGRLQVLGILGDFVQLPSVTQAKQLANSVVYGSEKFYAEQSSPNTHTSEALLPALALSPTVDGGTYRLDWYYEWALSNTSRDILCDVTVDGSPVSHHRQEPKDSSGDSAGSSWSGTDQSHTSCGFWEGALSSGLHSLAIEFATSKDDYQVTIYRSRMSLVRVS